MATEYLYELITKYVSPILDMCGVYMNTDGTFVYRSNNKTHLRFVNQRYSDKSDLPQMLIECVPLSDQHYLEIMANPEMEIFNPFTNRSHALGLLVLMREAMIPYCISDEKQNSCSDEDDYNLLANYINIYNSVSEDGQDIVGFTNTENPIQVKDLYSYKSDDVLKSCFGLAVIVYKDINRKYPQEYGDIDKAWRKILALCNKWAKARPEIKRDIKAEKQQQYDVNHMELSSGTIDNSFEPRLFDFYTDYLMPTYNNDCFNVFTPFGWQLNLWDKHDKYVIPNFQTVLDSQNNYLTSLFGKDSLTPVNEEVVREKDYEMVEPNVQNTPSVQNVMTFDGGNVTVTQESTNEVNTQHQANNTSNSTQNRGFSFGSKPQPQQAPITNYGQQFNPGLQMAVNNCAWNMYNQQMSGNKPSYDMNSLDLTGGDIVNPFSSYM